MCGFRSGASMLNSLCDSHNLIAVQEYWLRDDELNKFDLINKDFTFHGVSGMNKALSKNIIIGRPFGGVGFMWHSSLNAAVQPIACDSDRRCTVIKLTYNNKIFIVFNAYFPCFSHTVEHRDEISSLCGFIEDIISNTVFTDIIILADCNFDLNLNNAGYAIFSSLLTRAGLCACDDLVQGPNINTYANEALMSSSRIDHFFVSIALKPHISKVCVVESNCNFSDHRPISMCLAVDSAPLAKRATAKPIKPTLFKVRWDKSFLQDYYSHSREALASIDYNSAYLHCMNNYSYELKQKSIMWHEIWNSLNRPSSGLVHSIKCSVKLKYKLAIKQAFIVHENQFNDELTHNYLSKNTSDFWKSWGKKVHRNIEKDVFLNGSNDSSAVANAFAQHFEAVYCTSSAAADAKNEFESHFNECNLAQLSPEDISPAQITVELVDKCLRKLKLGKASGPDNLSAEHLLNAHPSLIIHICLLFRGIALHGYVPNDFGNGIIIPLLKD